MYAVSGEPGARDSTGRMLLMLYGASTSCNFITVKRSLAAAPAAGRGWYGAASVALVPSSSRCCPHHSQAGGVVSVNGALEGCAPTRARLVHGSTVPARTTSVYQEVVTGYRYREYRQAFQACAVTDTAMTGPCRSL
jgi:hypothetical protein